jgi:hypothetical protein
MNEQELRAILETAKAFKAAKIADIENQLAETYRATGLLEAALSEWKELVPADVIEYMNGQSRHEKELKEELVQQSKKESLHHFAMAQAINHNKGILHPSASQKSVSFLVFGSMLGLALAYLGCAANQISGLWHIVLLALGTIAGSVAGSMAFDRNFVVDESLETDHLPDRSTVKSTYFKGGPLS